MGLRDSSTHLRMCTDTLNCFVILELSEDYLPPCMDKAYGLSLFEQLTTISLCLEIFAIQPSFSI